MKVLNFGSFNLDNVYTLDHIVTGGETILSSRLETFCGGKGLNQSVALSRAGINVWHAGIIGQDGKILLDTCKNSGVNTDLIRQLPVKGGHTVIQVDKNGQNSIILYGGTNLMHTKEYIDEVLKNFGKGDYLILQNEINLLDYIIDSAYEKGMFIELNPSPFNLQIRKCNLSKIHLFMMNEIEGQQFTGSNVPDEILENMRINFPNAAVVLTLGNHGAYYYDGRQKIFQGIFKVNAVDTTAAGDTFTGFFMASVINGKTPEEALRIASKAASIAVTRPGAVPSIPTITEVIEELE